MFISLKLFFYTKKPCSSKAFKFFIKFYVSNEGAKSANPKRLRHSWSVFHG